MNVNGRTRAPKDGRWIICPHCGGASRVYHFSFSSLWCMYCKNEAEKHEWIVA